MPWYLQFPIKLCSGVGIFNFQSNWGGLFHEKPGKINVLTKNEKKRNYKVQPKLKDFLLYNKICFCGALHINDNIGKIKNQNWSVVW